jgi:RHS repeat-associated protein
VDSLISAFAFAFLTACSSNAPIEVLVWDVASSLPMLLQDGTNTYVYGLGLISIYDGSEMTYRLVDGLGSTVNLCNEDGDVVGGYLYDAYGNVRSQSGSETEFSFAGEQNDPNDLGYLRARYYDPEIGRFLSGDPLGGSLHLCRR